MLDTHDKITGIMPYFLGFSTYTFFVVLGIEAGVAYYWLNLRKIKDREKGAMILVAAALVFGIIGSKIPILMESRSFHAFLAGKSIVGGLVGGLLGVLLARKAFGVKQYLGHIITPSIALGIAIGRFGCFFGGCCYGAVASWGYDFGDGLMRLPTQLFESAFHFTAFAVLIYCQDKVKAPGLLFKMYFLAYFVFRFFSEFVRDNPAIWCGMTVYQIICGLGIVYFSIDLWIKNRAEIFGFERKGE